MSQDETTAGIEARNKMLKKLEVEGPTQDASATCVDRLMAAGKSRTEAERQCGEHEKNVKEMKYRDSFLGKIMSGIGK